MNADEILKACEKQFGRPRDQWSATDWELIVRRLLEYQQHREIHLLSAISNIIHKAGKKLGRPKGSRNKQVTEETDPQRPVDPGQDLMDGFMDEWNSLTDQERLEWWDVWLPGTDDVSPQGNNTARSDRQKARLAVEEFFMRSRFPANMTRKKALALWLSKSVSAARQRLGSQKN